MFLACEKPRLHTSFGSHYSRIDGKLWNDKFSKHFAMSMPSEKLVVVVVIDIAGALSMDFAQSVVLRAKKPVTISGN
jgi:hypothetical protein